MIVRVLKGALFLTLFAGILLTALYWYGSQDLPGYDDRGLMKLAQEKPTRGFNAADHLAFLEDSNFAFSLSPESRAKLRQDQAFNEWPLTEVMRVLSENGDSIQSFIYASDQAYLQWPDLQDDLFAAPSYEAVFTLARLTTIKAELLLASGNVDAAIDHALAPLKFSALMMSEFGRDASTSHLIGSVVQSRSLDLIYGIARSDTAVVDHIERLQVALERLPDYGNDRFDRILGIGFQRDLGYADYPFERPLSQRLKSLIEHIDNRADGEISLGERVYRLVITLFPRYFSHINRQKESLALGISSLASQHKTYCTHVEYPSMPARETPLQWLGPFAPNAAGGYEINYAVAYGALLNRRCLLYTEREVVRARLAYERYRAEHGEYPSEPVELVPQYLSSLPRDFFDGKPLRYSVPERVLYSVGENGADDGGSAEFSELGYFRCNEDKRCRKNPTFALPTVTSNSSSPEGD